MSLKTLDYDLSLSNLAEGAAIQKFDDELQKVLNNIVDPNTPADVTREVQLIVKIKPDKNRGYGDISIIAKSKLAPDHEHFTTCAIGKQAGKGVAREIIQYDMFKKPEGSNVVDFEGKKEEVDSHD